MPLDSNTSNSLTKDRYLSLILIWIILNLINIYTVYREKCKTDSLASTKIILVQMTQNRLCVIYPYGVCFVYLVESALQTDDDDYMEVNITNIMDNFNCSSRDISLLLIDRFSFTQSSSSAEPTLSGKQNMRCIGYVGHKVIVVLTLKEFHT